jgi:hypothetical protein
MGNIGTENECSDGAALVSIEASAAGIKINKQEAQEIPSAPVQAPIARGDD